MSFKTVPLKNFGLEIQDLDISRDIPAEVQRELYALWLEHGVLVFREMGTDTERHLRLAKVFGPLQQHPVARNRLASNPDLMLLATELDSAPAQILNGEVRRGFIYWHSDMSYVPDINKGSLLRGIRIPEQGGDTSWCDTAKAFEDLSDEMKARIETMSTIQTVRNVVPRPWGLPELSLRSAPEGEYGPSSPPPPFPLVTQPLVVTHGESGIRSLLLSPLGYVRIEGMEQGESDVLFEQLCRHALQEKYQYLHKWKEGDMVLWDNRRTMHCAHGYPVGMQREVQRATLAEVQPTGRLYEAADAA